MKTFVTMSVSDSIAEQIFGIIHLARMSLPKPYQTFANKAAKKIFCDCFNKNGNLTNLIKSCTKHPYRKINKKVAKSYKDLILVMDQLPDEIEGHYESTVALSTQTPINNALIDMIYAASKKELSKIEQLKKEFGSADIVAQLFETLKIL